MKILMIMPSYKPAYVYGGPIEALANLTESLVKRGESVTVYTTNANGPSDLDVACGEEFMVEGVRVYYFKRITGDHTNYSPQLLKALRQNAKRFDIIHLHSWWNLVTIPAAHICLARKIKPVISPRGTLTSYSFQHSKGTIKRWFHQYAGKSWLERSTLLFTSQQERMEAEKFLHPIAAYVLPNIHTFPRLPVSHNPNKEYLDILFLGRIDPAKNIEFLLQEFSQQLRIPYRLVIAGEGDPEYVNKLKAFSATNAAVSWVGRVDGIRKFELLGAADLLVLPSHTENYGNVILESLSQGTPVLISEKVGLKEYVQANQLGWIKETKPGEWSKILHDLWFNRARLFEIRDRARDRILKDFNAEADADKYIQLYSANLSRQV